MSHPTPSAPGTVPAQDLNGSNVSRLRDELVGAEILAGRELVENIGILADTADALNRVCQRQLRLLAEDHMATWRQLAGVRAPQQGARVALDHLQRRVEHVAEGVSEAAEILTRENDSVASVMFDLWRPFFGMLGGSRAPAAAPAEWKR